MTNKVQELTEKIYNEGINKARLDAEKIIAEAKTEADKIVQDAHKQREELLNKTEKEITEIKKHSNSEMQLAARQFLSHVKQQITNIITSAQVAAPVNGAFNDSEFLKKLILILVENWASQNEKQEELRLLLSKKQEDKLSAFFKSKAFSALNNDLEIKWDEKIKNGFIIGPKDGRYIIRFSNTDFENYFKKYFKEKTKILLFGEQEKNS